MNGAESLIRTLVACGVETCFANPGTTELHLVEAIGQVPAMRPVVGLFEGVCTGAADGYGRMSGRPAMTLLHLGPGLGNGIANLHNARRARTPILNVVGDHPSYHVAYDAPLTSDIQGLAGTVSRWVKSDSTAESLSGDGAAAVAATRTPSPKYQGQIATLIVPADAAWGDASGPVAAISLPSRPSVAAQAVDQAAQKLDAQSMLLLDGPGLSPTGLQAAARVAAATQCEVGLPTFPARVDIGPGRPGFRRLPYFPEQALDALKHLKRLVLAGAEAPVAFFGHPKMPSSVVPDGCEVVRLAGVEEDVVGALEALADAAGAAKPTGKLNERSLPDMPTGTLSVPHANAVLAHVLPEDCIVAVDSGGGNQAIEILKTAVPHTWLSLTGGSIGQGGPVATGAAVACPDRPVVALLGDGGAMYTLQMLWTQAREGLNVTTVIYSNRQYWILAYEYQRLGLPAGNGSAPEMFDIGNPDLGWVDLARGMGVPGCIAHTAEEFAEALKRSFAAPGPFLIEARTGARF